MKLNLEWKDKGGRYASGERLLVNGICVASYFWAKIMNDDKNYKIETHLPGFKPKVIAFDSVGECKVAAEKFVHHWFEKATAHERGEDA